MIDLIRHCRNGASARPGDLTCAEVMTALKAISADRALVDRRVHPPGLEAVGAVGG